MRVTRLKLANLRAIEAAEFRFQPGFNLIVGVNGVGKTSVLDALSVCLSAIVKHANRLRAKSRAFVDGDIRVGTQSLTAQCGVHLREEDYTYLVHKSRGSGEGHTAKSGMPREQAVDTPDKAEFVGVAPQQIAIGRNAECPVGVLFSTRRATASDGGPSKGSASGGIAAAYAEAFAHRDLQLAEFAAWMRAQEALMQEMPAAERVLVAFESAVRRFLPGYLNLRSSSGVLPRLMIDHGERATLRIDELTDAERARLKEALEWRDNWMALNWKADADWTASKTRRAYDEQNALILVDALARFLPNCENMRPDATDASFQLIDRRPVSIDVAQLSDGERGTLALVLDLTRRLSQANPAMTDPAAQAEAVVLIDEIDLHLHPKWQRQIVRNLVAAFPRCQFIATTHSPQVIGEVEHDRIQIIANGQVYSPQHSFGMDSSQVLEEIMDADPRSQEIKELLSRISVEVGQQQFDSARNSLTTLVGRLGEDDPEVTRLRTLLDFLEGEE